MSSFRFALCLAFVVCGSCRIFAEDTPTAADVSRMHLVCIEVSIVELAESPNPEESLDTEASQQLISRIRELETAGKLAGLTRLRLSALENNVATAQTSERASVVTTRSQFPNPGREGQSAVQSVRTQDYGTIVTAIPRVESEGTIILEVQIEKSSPVRTARTEQAETKADGFIPPRITTLQAKSTVRVPNGQTIILQGTGTALGETASRTVILLTAKADRPPNEPRQKAPVGVGDTILKIFKLKFASPGSIESILERLFRKQGLMVATDQRTNSLIIRGDAELLQIVEAILLRLDESPAPQDEQQKAAETK